MNLKTTVLNHSVHKTSDLATKASTDGVDEKESRASKGIEMNNHLEPCALCGCTKVPVRQGNGIGDYWLECTDCGMSTRLREAGDGTIIEAAKALISGGVMKQAQGFIGSMSDAMRLAVAVAAAIAPAQPFSRKCLRCDHDAHPGHCVNVAPASSVASKGGDAIGMLVRLEPLLDHYSGFAETVLNRCFSGQ
jgi:hypothetical protein